ncbi:MAG: hypothetical protein II180_00770 [Proteobacteria bacterium]|nr:hypothetical protein [Pseudomonadota bacterium]
MLRMTEKEILSRDNMHMFQYSLNVAGIKTMDFGVVFLLCLAVLIYPFTHFDPPAWMAAPIVLALIAITVLIYSQKWRRFAKKAFVAYDNEYLFVCNGESQAHAISWDALDLDNTGLKDPKAGANLMLSLEGKKIPLRLYTGIVCIREFETVLYTMLEHIQKNEKDKKK